MATNPNNIHLSQEDKQVLADLVDESGRELSEALQEAVTLYLERLAPTSNKANGEQNFENERERAFLQAAGTWADVDTDTLLAEMYAQRLRSPRPEPQL
jgi:hypothetical protein